MRRFLTSPRVFIILAPLILYAPLLFGGAAIYFGTPALQFHPWRVFALQSLLSGELPLWNPLSGMGSPLLANYQSAFLYPPNWILFLLGLAGQPAMAWGQGLLVVLHLIFAGLGMSRLVRWLGAGELAQAVGGLAFSLSGYLVARAHFLSINAALAWLPWVLWAAGDLARTGRGRGRILRLVLAIAMLLLAGHAQTAWYTLLLAGAWLAFWSWRQPASHSQNPGSANAAGRGARAGLPGVLRALLWFSAAGLAAAGLAAIQLLPTAELLAQSQRAGGADLDFVMTYSFWPWRFLGLLMPGFFGSPVSGSYWGYGNFWEDAVYIGLLPFFLALAALRRGRPKALVWFLGALAGVSFLLALGQNTPVFPFLYRHVPTFDLFQAPTRFSIWAVFALAMLAALGVDAWQPPADPGQRARAGRWVAVALAVALGGLAARIAAPYLDPSFSAAAMLAGLLGAAAGFFGLAIERRPWWRWGVVGLIGLDLLIAGWGLNPAITLAFYRDTPLPQASILNTLGEQRLYIGEADEYALTFERFFEFKGFAAGGETYARALRGSMLPNLNLLYRLPSVNNFDPLLVGRYARWIENLESAGQEQRDWMLAEMSVGLVSVFDEETEAGVRFEPFEGRARLEWFPCALPADSPNQAWEQLFSSPSRTAGELVVEDFPAGPAPDCGLTPPSSSFGQARFLLRSNNELRIRLDASAPGWLLVRDTFYPGWQATVNGADARVHAANYLFRAVQVPAGQSEVVLRYRPAVFYLGAAVSMLAVLGLALFAAWKFPVRKEWKPQK